MAGPGWASEFAVEALRALSFGEAGGRGRVAAVGFGADLVVNGWGGGGATLAEVGEEEPGEGGEEDGTGGCADADADFGAGGESGRGRRGGRGCGCW